MFCRIAKGRRKVMSDEIICEKCQIPMKRAEENYQFSDVVASRGVSSTGFNQSDYPGSNHEEEPETEIVDYKCPGCGAKKQILREI
jgi:Zn finger protein HypA/HybF involved in hydrogenase expression